MPGTSSGGKKVRDKLLAADPDFYRKMGAIGGKLSHKGGFYGDPVLAARAGKIGGKLSSRKGIKNGQGKNYRPKPTIISKVRRAFHV